jgi:hypothetical protein
MKVTYVDSSCLVAISLGETGSWDLLGRISRLVRWVLPHRPLTREINQILAVGRLRGPDLWHLASALFLRRQVADLSLVTLDTNQGDIAHALGLQGL